MTDRPIIMSTESVKAILDGRKTQTRRVIKPQPYEYKETWVWAFRKEQLATQGFWLDHSPYGQVSQRLWVRETWAIRNCGNRVSLDKGTWPEGFPIDRLEYIATDPAPIPPELADDSNAPHWWNKRPSLFMPRWASRITLEITGVRVERLQEITEEDAIAEGIDPRAIYVKSKDWEENTWFSKEAFHWLWDSLNAKRGYGWDTNPFVWAISFKKEQKDE